MNSVRGRRRAWPAVMVMAGAAAGLVAVFAGSGGASAGVGLAGPGAVRGAAGSWGRAIEIPGLAALNAGGGAGIGPVSCPSARNCVAAGAYADRAGKGHGFVISERQGRWGRAIKVPGLDALNTGPAAGVGALACASAGDCAASGNYTDGAGRQQAFVVSERSGRWGRAIEIPGLGALNAGGGAADLSTSCGSPGNCVVAGQYQDSIGLGLAFVVGERNGTWGKAIEVPGVRALSAGGNGGVGGFSSVDSVSCPSAGNCAATGYYLNRFDRQQGFAVSERAGIWGKAIEIPGLAALNSGGIADAVSVSCASPGNCAAGGSYLHHGVQGFVVSERSGVWGKAIAIRGLEALNTTGEAEVISVACGSATSCVAVGDYADRLDGFTVTERGGVWGKVSQIPGLRALNRDRQAFVSSVSCASDGNCAAGGFYQDGPMDFPAFVVSERNGTWGQAIPVPGLRALNRGGDAQILSVSCTAGYCAADGIYLDGSLHTQGFLVTERHNR